MKKLNGEMKLSGVKFSLSLSIGEISFKEESTRKDSTDKRNFKHNVAKDVKLSLNSETEEIILSLEGLNDMIKEAVKDTVQAIKEVAEPVEDEKLNFCRDYLEGSIKPRTDKEYKNALKRYFGYTTEYLNNPDHSPEALLRREAKNYLVKRINTK